MSTSDTRRAEFVARVTADVTHELRNALAIVRETAGLIDDVIEFEQSAPPDLDKIRTLVGRIEPQTNRGAELVSIIRQVVQSCMSRDLPTELNQAAAQVAVMCHRFAKRRRQSVETRPHSSEVHVAVEGLTVSMVIYAAVECCLEMLPESAVLAINVGKEPHNALLALTSSVARSSIELEPTQSVSWKSLRETAADVDASLEVDREDSILRIVFAAVDAP